MTELSISNEVREVHTFTPEETCIECGGVEYPCAAVRLADAYDALYEVANFARNELSGFIAPDSQRNHLLAEVWEKLEIALSGEPK